MTHYNLAVIGGGINGVAIACDAALRGLKVLLVEKNTIGSGTSSKTSKLAHGGLRYLEQFELGLVRESLYERNLLLKNAPTYVKPLPFIIPIYQDSQWHPLMLKIGLSLYDFLSGKKDLSTHKTLKKKEILHKVPGLKSDTLKTGFRYYDAQMDDIGIIKSLATLSKRHGVTILENTLVTDLVYKHHQAIGLNVQTKEGKMSVMADKIIQATGPWTNQLQKKDDPSAEPVVLATKGVHIVLPGLPVQDALLLSTPQDHRVFFIIPWQGKTLIGTTDTAYHGNPDTLIVSSQDREYLLTAYNTYFPEDTRTSEDILEAFVGLRPLLNMPAGKSTSQKSRDYKILESPSGLLTIAGGKFTTHRAMAEAAVDQICESLGPKKWKACQTKTIKLP